MNHFIERNNRFYNLIAPLGAGLFYTQTKKTKIKPALLGFIICSEEFSC